MAGEVKRANLPFDTFEIDDKFDQLLMLVYGGSDVGKTVLAGSASVVPDMAPVCYMDINKGSVSLAQFGYGKGGSLVPVKVEHCGRGNEKRRFTTVYGYLANNRDAFKTLVVDGLDDLQRIIESETKEEYGANQDVRQYWGVVLEKMQNALRMIKDLDMHVIATAQETTYEDKNTGSVMTVPALRGSIVSHIKGYFDTVGRLMVRKVEGKDLRVLHVGGTSKFIGRDRLGTIGEMVDGQGPLVLDPTMEKIYEMSQENRGEDTNEN